jgi:hypothetical protein
MGRNVIFEPNLFNPLRDQLKKCGAGRTEIAPRRTTSIISWIRGRRPSMKIVRAVKLLPDEL